ncbi:MAG: nucleoside hydrolase [Anaerolineae bacterium]|nr:nucleoside hydrolase [Anaerolineae bacterium]
MGGQERRKVIFDTDIGWMNDDCTAAMFALLAPELDVLGITPVMGNFDLNWSMACALRLIEILGRADVPVCRGFDRPLLHERDPYADRVWGKWATFEEVTSFPAGMPALQPDPRHAVEFIAESVRRYPGEVTLLAVGPLTTVAIAIRQYPEIIEQVQEVIIMGGAISTLPRGHGNITPAAEFNFWVDPEAARIVLRSGMPITLLPMNVCRQTSFARETFNRLTAPTSAHPAAARLIHDYLLRNFEDPAFDRENARLYYGMYDHTVVGYAINPGLYRSIDMNVDVSVIPGPDYGVSYGYEKGPYVSGVDRFPLEDGSQAIRVVYDLDFPALVEMYVRALTGAH